MTTSASASKRPFLIFSAFGLGPGTVPFTRPEGDKATWDLAEVLWARPMIDDFENGRYETIAEHVFCDDDRTKRKFCAFAELVKSGAIDISGYRAVLLADDDLEPAGCTWSDVFALFEETGMAIAQPALSPDSTKAWPITHQVEGCIWRETDFIECMMPIVRADVLAELLPYFEDERNGWGLENLFHAHAKCKPMGVLDATPVRHVRPIGSAHNVSGLPTSGEQMAADFCKRHGLDITKKGGVTLVRHGATMLGTTGIEKIAKGSYVRLPKGAAWQALPGFAVHELPTGGKPWRVSASCEVHWATGGGHAMTTRLVVG